jgi:hypothetical protein
MIPAFSAAGVIPPFVGEPASLGPRSPYAVGVRDVVERFATSTKRCDILRGWLGHRAAVHSLGLTDGFQWLDGSFCERLIQREPNDVDLVTFFAKPPGVDLRALIAANRAIFRRGSRGLSTSATPTSYSFTTGSSRNPAS